MEQLLAELKRQPKEVLQYLILMLMKDNKISYEDRFKKLDTSITQLNLTIHGIHESLVRFEGQFASIQQTLNTQAETLSSFNGSLEDFLGRLETVEQEINTIKSKVPGL